MNEAGVNLSGKWFWWLTSQDLSPGDGGEWLEDCNLEIMYDLGPAYKHGLVSHWEVGTHNTVFY